MNIDRSDPLDISEENMRSKISYSIVAFVGPSVRRKFDRCSTVVEYRWNEHCSGTRFSGLLGGDG